MKHIETPRPIPDRRCGLKARAAAGLGLLILMAGCVSQTVRTVDMTPPKQAEEIIPEDRLLDVGVAIFDPNIPETYDEQVEALIQPELRRAEANYIPYFAKTLLQSTGNWGAVRVVPRPTDAVDVMLSGKILHSDGERLHLQVAVDDARGVRWFDREYETLASKYAYDESMPDSFDPFQTIYKQISDDMLAYLQTLTPQDIGLIRATAEMKFARAFAPDAFEDYVAEEAGRFEVKRLPAESDPMLGRVRKVREREYLFIDTLDEYYDGFHRDMYPHYQDWRKASYDLAIEYQKLRTQARQRAIVGTAAIVGGVAAAYSSDNAATDLGGYTGIVSGAYTLATAVQKLHEATIFGEMLHELGVSTEAEITPHTLQLENQTVRLQGTVDAQYEQLRQILKKTYFEDLGMTVPDTPDPEQ